MILATNADVAKRLGRPLEAGELVRVEGLLEEASVIVEGYCNRLFAAPVPTAVVIAVSRCAARALGAPEDQGNVDTNDFTAGPFRWSQTMSGDSMVWLGNSEKKMLAPHRISVVSVGLVSDRRQEIPVVEDGDV